MSVSFTTKRVLLAGLVSKAAPVVPSSRFRPVLCSFQVSFAPGHLRLAATDTDLTIFASHESVTTSDAATILLPASRLAAILKEAPEGDVTVTAEGTTATVVAGGTSWELRTDPGEFPVLPDLSGVEFASTGREELLGALRTVRHAVPPDSVSPAQASITIAREGDGQARVTAFGPSRYQQARLGSFPLSILVPALGTPSAADELIRLLGATDLASAGVAQCAPWTAVEAGSAVFAYKTPLAKPADAGRLLAAVGTNTQFLTVSRDALVTAIRRVRLAADEKTGAIRLELFPGSVAVHAKDIYSNTAVEEIPAQWEGKQRTVVVHHRYLLDALSVHPSPECRFALPSAAKRAPILLKDEASGTCGIINQLAPGAAGMG